MLMLAITFSFCSTQDITTDKLPDPIKIELRSSETEMVKSDQQFAFEFFKNVFNEEAQGNDNNFMVSPLSLSIALAMTWNGASGETKTVMQNTLKLQDYTDKEINDYYKKIKETLLKTDPTTKLAIANSIWTNKNVPIKQEFIDTNKEYFNSTVESVDFANPATVGRINSWAADNTNNLIDKVLDETSIDALMYLLNALYFKGIWANEFDAKNTSKKPFTYESGTVKNIDMMHQKSQFMYGANDTFEAVLLPYGNKAFSMMVLLPKEGKKLTDINTVLQNNSNWTGFRKSMIQTEVELYLPKFKTEYSKRLNESLKAMGMGIAFAPGSANFSRMSDAPSFISFVDQFTYISTDEKGTEAAAVTVVGVELTSYNPSKSVVFNANKPFIYIIQENSTGSILFMGAVKNFE